ncbi:aminoacetone oxidase family FAD-binding enzyme [Aminipila luticellarii]|uniref:Aminoacetone oxidase family FAD-binding enzyme n=1 Tax=Aminipila luticellarii TaxID=2507160 RepID=A0A410PU38_9FIRM|nr:aminoacetone oxidase family FAD-binding enzyme [Aminipila luticellarii]QAT42467.1 aminoacetone oxidase family FAD-binding enzyme [Aminipila luticellarii]
MGNNQKCTKSLYDIFFDICIIGGGASGLAAAISIMEQNPTLSVCIIEKKEDIGKKLLATGNGRCNITNSSCEEYEEVKSFLYSSGIMLKEEEEGRVYPRSEQAAAVTELLKWRAKKLNITIFTNCQVLSIIKVKREEQKEFNIHIDCAEEKVFIPCRKVIMSCGGKSAPQFGTTGDGYAIAKAFGHTVSKLHPALMPIQCEGIKKSLKGIRAKGKVTLLKNEKPIAEECGEIQFTEEGLSGICIFNLTRYLILEQPESIDLDEAFKKYTVEIDFLPEMEEDEVIEFLKERRFVMAAVPAPLYLASVINMELGEQIISEVLGDKTSTVGNITYEGIEEIAMLLKSSRYTVTGAKGWREAQCTGGGVLLDEVCMDTMESKMEEGLYFAGEILDYDGPCGGYNLHHAWLTGIKAGKSAAKALAQKTVIGE